MLGFPRNQSRFNSADAAMSQNLPKPEGTTSTNFGADFGIYTTALLSLRCCMQEEDVTIVIGDNDYSPWHDLVLRHRDRTVCVLATHESELKNKKKLKASLNRRREVLKKHGGVLEFARVGVATNDALKKQFPKAQTIPDALRLLLTNACVHYDKEGRTYFCMEQHDVSALESDVEDALRKYIGADYIAKAQLRKVQRNFLDYLRNRFYRLIEVDTPLTIAEIRRHLAYIILGLFKVAMTRKKPVSGEFTELLREDLVVLNVKSKSVVKIIFGVSSI
ncbi:hypothetical protein FQR65_LT12571 [Abscondita terminalis]|nr:hypothetical protein FQR65_LT12571 [Abscondita terminalis]